MRKRRLVLGADIFLAALIVCGGIAVAVERQNLSDWWRLRGYQAPATVAQLATQTTMDAYARKIFYVNHPDIESKNSFYNSCPNNGGEKTVVLGCYHSNQRGIFVLSVQDSRLYGVEQVTAAHEMLHAAYDRLSARDKTYVDGLLMNYYKHDLHDQRLLSTIAAYKQSEPNDVVNEMHSVFGTEVAHLPKPLETYYKRYFTDRQKVAEYAAQYEAAFTSRQQQVKQDDTTLANLKAQISADETELQIQKQAIADDQQRLNSLSQKHDYSAYNAGVPAFNAKIDTYNALVGETRDLIAQYDALVQKRNAIALEENQLVNDISPAPTLIK
jgi:hypothetical protein